VIPGIEPYSGINSNYIMGMSKVENQVKILLDKERILHEEELEQVMQVK